MAVCEKCWADAFARSYGTPKSQSEAYRDLLDERKDHPCTPEQQAGEDALMCPKCGRNTLHQYCKACMVPGCDGRLSRGQQW